MLPNPEALTSLGEALFLFALALWGTYVTILWTALTFHCTSLTRHELFKKSSCFCLAWVSQGLRTVEYIVGAHSVLSRGQFSGCQWQAAQILGLSSSLHENQRLHMFVYLMNVF